MADIRTALAARVAAVTPATFNDTALAVYAYQRTHNPVYAEFLRLSKRPTTPPAHWSAIPALPIELFKSRLVRTGDWSPEAVFTSSGTTGQAPSRHAVRDLSAYLANARRGFAAHYGPVENYCTLALLPAYLERRGSSLVAMANDFIRRSRYAASGFFLYDTAPLLDRLRHCREQHIPVLLIGVSFALLDLAETAPGSLGEHVVVMETGGMKGRRRELTRAELHTRLGSAFGQSRIHSEYGMTELLSQGYSKGDGLFHPAPTLRVGTRELTDPFSAPRTGKSGAVNLVDLANLDTCSFIATQDIGICYDDNSFRILGRQDAGDVRGCNLMVSDL